MRNILAHIPAKNKESFAAKLKQIWQQPDCESAKRYAKLIIQVISCYLIEYAEDWETSRCYIKKNTIQQIITRRKAA